MENEELKEKLKKAQESFRNIVESSGDGIIVLDYIGNICYINKTAIELFSRNPEKIIGEFFGEIISGSKKMEVLRPDGETRIVELSLTQSEWEGKPARLVIIHDITEFERHQQILYKAFLGTAEALTKAIEKRDPYTKGHCIGVANLSQSIGEEMGLEKEKLTGLYVCGILHDIGKIAIPSEILTKPGKLTELEMEMIKTHVIIGYEILKDIDFPWPVSLAAIQHHERMDGSGYPYGLKGEEIILEARIIAVADVIDAMKNYRPYRPAFEMEVVIDEIEKNKGTKYDEEVVNAYLRIWRKEKK